MCRALHTAMFQHGVTATAGGTTVFGSRLCRTLHTERLPSATIVQPFAPGLMARPLPFHSDDEGVEVLR